MFILFILSLTILFSIGITTMSLYKTNLHMPKELSEKEKRKISLQKMIIIFMVIILLLIIIFIDYYDISFIITLASVAIVISSFFLLCLELPTPRTEFNNKVIEELLEKSFDIDNRRNLKKSSKIDYSFFLDEDNSRFALINYHSKEIIIEDITGITAIKVNKTIINTYKKLLEVRLVIYNHEEKELICFKLPFDNRREQIQFEKITMYIERVHFQIFEIMKNNYADKFKSEEEIIIKYIDEYLEFICIYPSEIKSILENYMPDLKKDCKNELEKGKHSKKYTFKKLKYLVGYLIELGFTIDYNEERLAEIIIERADYIHCNDFINQKEQIIILTDGYLENVRLYYPIVIKEVQEILVELIRETDLVQSVKNGEISLSRTKKISISKIIDYFEKDFKFFIGHLYDERLSIEGNEKELLEIIAWRTKTVFYNNFVKGNSDLIQRSGIEPINLTDALSVISKEIGLKKLRSDETTMYVNYYFDRELPMLMDQIDTYIKLKEIFIKKDNFKAKLENINREKSIDRPITIEDVDKMEGFEFEEFLTELFTKMGYRAENTKKTGDQGVDLLIYVDDYIIAVQAKRSSSSIGNTAIQEVFTGKEFYESDRNIVIDKTMAVTNNYFTPKGYEIARSTDTLLCDRENLKFIMELVL